MPGLYKIFDEILVNAADNKQRDPSMDTIRIDIDPAHNTIRVWNNGAPEKTAASAWRRQPAPTSLTRVLRPIAGRGIPVVVHKEEGVYIPELIFGYLLTSSNYDDSQRKGEGSAPPRTPCLLPR